MIKKIYDKVESKRDSKSKFWRALVSIKDIGWRLNRKIKKRIEDLAYNKQPYKIFGIGTSRTGTKSLTEALKMLGIKSSHWEQHKEIRKDIDKNNFNLQLLKEYDAILDHQIPSIFKELEKEHPKSKFILTIRNKKTWIKSIENFFKNKGINREDILFLKIDHFDKKVFLQRFKAHNKDVIKYFKDKPEKLLVLDIEKGDGWKKLCKFLDKRVPKKPFPWANKGGYREKRK